jgi:hypothetical protein
MIANPHTAKGRRFTRPLKQPLHLPMGRLAAGSVRQADRQTHPKASLKLVCADVIGTQRGVNDDGAAIARRSRSVLAVLLSAHDKGRPRR